MIIRTSMFDELLRMDENLNRNFFSNSCMWPKQIEIRYIDIHTDTYIVYCQHNS